MEERLPRVLTVILHADVVGYSRLAGEDEDATHRRLKESLELIDNQVSAYHGRIVNTAGDAVLAMFDAVVDAVSCAVAIQHDLAAYNKDIADSRKLLFRIGVNLGDVIEDGGNIYGDGVNVAARLEGLAEPGGICISEQVYMAVGSKLELDYQDIGAQAVKNIAQPVQAYNAQLKPGVELPPPSERRKPVGIPMAGRRSMVAALAIILVVAGGILAWLKPWQSREEPASVDRMSFPLPDKPSIAVLAFDNLSGDPEKDYFVDGFTEDIITGLSQFSELFVIAKSSSFSYKDKQVKVGQVAEELGVRFVLDGSVRMTETDLLVTSQLIDATSGRNIWAERYERPLTEFHTIQSDVLDKIVSTVAERIENIGLRIASRKQTENLNAYEHVLQGYDLVYRWNKEDNEQARTLFELAIELDPLYARAYSGLGFAHNIAFGRSWSADPELSLDKARKASLKAISLDDSDNRPHVVLGWAYINGGQYDKGVAELNKGISLNPNDAGVLARSGYALTYYGEFQQAIDQAERAMRINPFHPGYYYDVLAWAQYFLKRYDDALRTLSHVSEPNMSEHRTLAATYARLGKMDKAQYHAKKILELNPEFTLNIYAKSQPFKYPEHLGFHLESLRLAGLPDNPIPKLPDKPSIAVLPFTNMSGDPEQEYFADGMTDDLITDLSKMSGLFVVSRNSSFAYKGLSVDLTKVSRDLGVKYILEGSVRRVGDQIRINAQLIEAATGGHLWAERFDGTMADVFSLQDDVNHKIVTALAVSLTADDRNRLDNIETTNPEAYDMLLRGFEQYQLFSLETNLEARENFMQAISIDPSYARAYANVALTYGSEVNFSWTQNREESIQLGLEYAAKALDLDKNIPQIYMTRSMLYLAQRRYDAAAEAAQRTIEVHPNYADGRASLAFVLSYTGELKQALEAIRQAKHLNPRYSYIYLAVEGRILFLMKRYQEALEVIEESVNRNPVFERTQLVLAAINAQLGEVDNASWAVEEAMSIKSDISITDELRDANYKRARDLNHYIEALRKAGVPE